MRCVRRSVLASTAAFLVLYTASAVAGAEKPADGAKAAAPAPEDVLRLANGDVLHGTLLGLAGSGADAHLSWRPWHGSGCVDIPAARVAAVELGAHPSAAAKAHAGTVTLTNGDVLPGDPAEMDEKRLLLDTWYAGKIAVPRPALAAAILAAPKDAETPLCDSRRDGLKGWTERWIVPGQSSGRGRQWSCEAGVFSTTNDWSSLQLDPGPLPESLQVEFDVAATNALSFGFCPFFDMAFKPDDEKGRGPTFQFDGGMQRINFSRMDPERRWWSSDSDTIPRVMRSGGATEHFTVMTDRTTGAALIFLNGKILRAAMFPDEVKRGGNVFTFYRVDSGVRISNVRVSRWNGVVRFLPQTAERSARDQVSLEGGDRIQGRLLSLSAEKLRLSTSYGAKGRESVLEFPRGRVLALGFARAPEPAAGVPTGVCVRLAGAAGGCLTLEPEVFADGVLKGLSVRFGEVSLKAEALSRLEWRPVETSGRKLRSASRSEDVLELANGDMLHGTLSGVTAGAAPKLSWKPAGAQGTAEFALTDLETVRLHHRPAADSAKGRRDSVLLGNGDRLTGRMLSFDAETLTLETVAAGKLTVPRPAIRAIRPGSGDAGAVYTGPSTDGLSGWSMPEGAASGGAALADFWACEDGVLYAVKEGASIGRELKALPEAACLDFDLAWDQPCNGFTLAFFTDRVPRPGEYNFTGYLMGVPLAGSSVSMESRTQGSSRGTGTSADYTVPADARKTHVTFKADRTKGNFSLLMDGRQVCQFKDFSRGCGTGKHVAFLNVPEGLAISNVRVTAWDEAKQAGTAAATASADPKAPDLLLFANGDSLAGRFLLPAGSAKARLETDLGAPMEVPLERIAEVAMNAGKPPAAKTGAVRTWLDDGACMTLEQAEVAGGRLRGRAFGAGAVEIPLDSVLRLEVVQPPPKKKPGKG